MTSVARSSSFVIRRSSFRPAGFTLVEIIIALTIVIIIAAASIPTFKGLRAEQQALEPVQELTRMAKEARLRAMREKRPYQIVFHGTGFTAMIDPMTPFICTPFDARSWVPLRCLHHPTIGRRACRHPARRRRR